MENKIYHLSTCNTCQKIIKTLNDGQGCELINIKTDNVDAATLDYAAAQLGSYEALFSRKAMKYRQLGLNEKQLTEEDYRKYILEEYTFLKRPLMIIKNQVFAGNAKATVEAAKNALDLD